MKGITSSIELEEHCGKLVPKDPWDFARQIEATQYGEELTSGETTILFNKGRYFEAFVYGSLLDEVAELTSIPVEYNMLCASWRKLEDFVVAMNCFGIRVVIKVDWV